MLFRKIVYTLAAVHLGLITLVICHVIDEHKAYRFLEQPFAFLTAINYSIWKFGFFTPDIGRSTEVEIYMSGPGQQPVRYSTLEGFEFFTNDHENRNRFYGYKIHSARDTTFINLSARSACVYMLNEHPGMDYIQFVMRGITYPSMKEFRQDSTYAHEEFYCIEFTL